MPHRESYEVRYFDSGANQRATPVALYSYLQETALRHCDHVGLTTQRLFEMGYTWMLNRVHVQALHYPRYKSRVTVETWPVNISGLYSLREFLVYDETETLCAKATTRWVLIDVAKRRPTKPPESMADGFELGSARAVEDEFPKIAPVEEPVTVKTFHVRLSDLDINQHANSACYFDWILETAPEEVLRTMTPASVEIFYRQEAGLGTAIEAVSEEKDAEGTRRVFVHALREPGTDTLLAQGRSVWRNESGSV